jgi:hypothetical protein
LWVASLPGAFGRVTSFGTTPLLLATAGLLLIGLLKTPLRWSGAMLHWLFCGETGSNINGPMDKTPRWGN